MARIYINALALTLPLSMPTPTPAQRLQVTVAAGAHDRTGTPVQATLCLPAAWAQATSAVLVTPAGERVEAQLTGPSVLNQAEPEEGQAVRELHFIMPSLPAGESMTLEGRIHSASPANLHGFRWHDVEGEYAELRLERLTVLRYMYAPLDESSPEARQQTYKVYHHLFDAQGCRVTKGPYGLYPHHRGLFYGFNRVTYGDGRQVDIWHCTGDTYQSHDAFLSTEEGPVLGRHRVLVHWHGVGKEVFATEEREMTAYRVPGGVLVEFASLLRSTNGPVILDGDPQHAGFHFRAEQEVAETTKDQTYYLRPDGRGQPGETRNWPDRRDHVNLPWNAMSFVLGGRRYTALYLDHPDNPKEARYSERDYGRFGSYFRYELDPAHPLRVHYRIWLQEGEMSLQQAQAASADFIDPPQVEDLSL